MFGRGRGSFSACIHPSIGLFATVCYICLVPWERKSTAFNTGWWRDFGFLLSFGLVYMLCAMMMVRWYETVQDGMAQDGRLVGMSEGGERMGWFASFV